MKKLFALFALVGLVAAVTGCDTTSKQSRNAVGLYSIGDYTAAANVLAPEAQKKDEHFVLNNLRYGSAALAAGQLENAENAFLAAYEVMNGVKTNDGGRTMGAVLVFEGVKVWKGEPFERAMAHYYLGLVYLIKNDYENARAAFQNSVFKLRDYAEDAKKEGGADKFTAAESSFALGYYGLGLCNLRLNKLELADQNFELAVKYDPRLKQLVEDTKKPGTNTLVFVDYGSGPRREARGWYNEESVFGPTPAQEGPLPPVVVTANGQTLNFDKGRYATTDTLALAQEGKWQDIDTIRKTKAVIGTGMMAAGTGVAAYALSQGDSGTALVGLGILAAGALVSASSQADTRSWEMLPRTVYVVPATLPPGEQEITVQVGGATPQTLKANLHSGTKNGAKADNVLYFRVLAPHANYRPVQK